MVAVEALRGPGCRLVVVVTPALDAMGGISRVNALLQGIGLFGTPEDGLEIRLHPSTLDGGVAARMRFSAWQLFCFALTPLPRGSNVHLHASRHAGFWRKSAHAWVAFAKRASVLMHVHPTHFMDFHEGSGPPWWSAIRATLRRCRAMIVLTDEMASRLRSLAAAIERLLGDAALREAMSQANRADARRYDVRTIGASLLEPYRELGATDGREGP
jgi:hypothetical protein